MTVFKKSTRGSAQERSQRQCLRKVPEAVFKEVPRGKAHERSQRQSLRQ